MPCSVYQYVINLSVSLPIRRGPGVFMNFSIYEYCVLRSYIFSCGKLYYINTITITIF